MALTLFGLAPRRLPLRPYERKITSPNGVVEEGVIERIFSILHPSSRFCVEFGAGDGTNHSFTRNLIERHGFSALLIEASPALVDPLKTKYSDSTNIKVLESFITRENIEELFARGGVPLEFDFLCIDIDGNDFHIWNSIAKYSPRIVCIEFNGAYGPHQEFVLPYNPEFVWQGDDFFGASFASLVRLAKQKGYDLIHCTSAGDNLFFARQDVAAKFERAREAASEFYQVPQYGKYGRAVNGKGHPASKQTSSALTRLMYKARYYAMTLPRKFVYMIDDPKGHR
jgi:hypothetical protein